MVYLVLPDRWRVELMRRPADRDEWLRALEARQDVSLVDWSTKRPAADALLLFAGLDLAAAEFIIKLPPEVRVAAVAPSPLARLVGGRSALLKRAWARVDVKLAALREPTLPPYPAPFLTWLLTQAGVTA